MLASEPRSRGNRPEGNQESQSSTGLSKPSRSGATITLFAMRAWLQRGKVAALVAESRRERRSYSPGRTVERGQGGIQLARPNPRCSFWL